MKPRIHKPHVTGAGSGRSTYSTKTPKQQRHAPSRYRNLRGQPLGLYPSLVFPFSLSSRLPPSSVSCIPPRSIIILHTIHVGSCCSASGHDLEVLSELLLTYCLKHSLFLSPLYPLSRPTANPTVSCFRLRKQGNLRGDWSFRPQLQGFIQP